MSGFAKDCKRLLDVVVVIVVSPLVVVITAIIAISVRLGSPGSAIFAQQRAGRGGKPFALYKFRTMRLGVDPFGPSPKKPDDPRLTRLGRWLRTMSLDELPQLWNVLKGDMSIVGPRPLYLEQAQTWDSHQRRRLEVRPGITGLAQISGRGSLTIEDKIELDVKYVQTQSLWLDAKIIWATVLLVFGARGIYEKKYSRTQETRKTDNRKTDQ